MFGGTDFLTVAPPVHLGALNLVIGAVEKCMQLAKDGFDLDVGIHMYIVQ